ncbi:hypothetical protein M8J77_021461 [Diaphorina citri]|nr:hypothetical protein M8J77_021461 [Diaphorina citri]
MAARFLTVLYCTVLLSYADNNTTAEDVDNSALRRYEDIDPTYKAAFHCYCRSIERYYELDPLPCDQILNYQYQGDEDMINQLLKNYGVPFGHGTKDELAELYKKCYPSL